jgi:hypothetical protein
VINSGGSQAFIEFYSSFSCYPKENKGVDSVIVIIDCPVQS